FTAASVGSAVRAACLLVREKLFNAAKKMDGSPLADAKLEQVTFADGQIHLSSDPSRAVAITDVTKKAALDSIEMEASAQPGPKRDKFATYTHSAIFAEVKVDQDLGVIRVPRIVSAVAGGRIINPKT